MKSDKKVTEFAKEGQRGFVYTKGRRGFGQKRIALGSIGAGVKFICGRFLMVGSF